MDTAVKETRTEEKHNAIIRAAEELFMQNGYATTSMDAIAEHAGVSKQTIYAHFQNKENLFIGMMDGMCSRFGCPLDDAQDMLQTAPLAEALHVIGFQLLRLITRPEAMGLIRLVISESPRNPELGRIFYEQGPADSHEKLAALLAEKTQKGEINTPNPQQAAEAFFAMVYDPIHMKSMMGLDVPTDEATLSAHVTEVTTRFIKAYTA